MAGAPAPLRLAVYDARRGNKEGREHEKMLCYFPSSTPVPAQVNHVGFAQACSMFAEHFTAEVSSAPGCSAAVSRINANCSRTAHPPGS